VIMNPYPLPEHELERLLGEDVPAGAD